MPVLFEEQKRFPPADLRLATPESPARDFAGDLGNDAAIPYFLRHGAVSRCRNNGTRYEITRRNGTPSMFALRACDFITHKNLNWNASEAMRGDEYEHTIRMPRGLTSDMPSLSGPYQTNNRGLRLTRNSGFVPSFDNFYLSDVIGRSSMTMGKCACVSKGHNPIS
jgi:hypothetical protein